MREELIRRLGETTPEEARLLRGAQVDRTAYTFAQDFTVDRDKMLRRGQMIALRKHTRFAPFPRHSHNYVEMLYMIRGRTVHHIDDAQTVTLQAGELCCWGRAPATPLTVRMRRTSPSTSSCCPSSSTPPPSASGRRRCWGAS